MAAMHGRSGSVKFGTTFVGKVTNFTYEETADTAESTCMSDLYKQFLPGLIQGSGSVDFRYEEDNVGQLAIKSALSAGTIADLVLYPLGSGATGTTLMTGTCIVTSYSYTQSMDDVVNASFAFNGVLRFSG